MEDGSQIIDMRITTPYEALTPLQMVEYTEMDHSLPLWNGWRGKHEEKQSNSGNMQGICFGG